MGGVELLDLGHIVTRACASRGYLGRRGCHSSGDTPFAQRWDPHSGEGGWAIE